MINRKMFDNVIIEMTRQISYPVDGDPIEAIKEDLADQEFIIQSVDSLVIDEKKVLCDSLNPCNSFWKTNITASLNVLMNCPNNILFIGEENCKVNIKPSPLYTSGQEKFNCDGVYKFISHVTYEYKNISFPITLLTFNNDKKIKAIEIYKQQGKKSFEGKEVSNPHRASISIHFNEFIPQFISIEDKKPIKLTEKDKKEILSYYVDGSEIIDLASNSYETLDKYVGKKIDLIVPAERPLMSKCFVVEPNDDVDEIDSEMVERFKELIDNLFNLDLCFDVERSSTY